MPSTSHSSDDLTYVGHATTLLRLAGFSALTDPLLRRQFGPLRRQVPEAPAGIAGEADAILISHLHRDHLDLRSLRRIAPGTPVVVPRGGAGLASRAGADRVHEIGEGESVTLGPLEVTAVPALHDGRRDPWSRPAPAHGFLIEGGGRRVYFAGDTDLFERMADLAPLDLALIPVWGWGPTLGEGHLDPERAARALALLQPRLAVPIHWGTIYPLGLRRLRPGPLTEPPLEFARRAAELAPEVEVHVLPPGASMSL